MAAIVLAAVAAGLFFTSRDREPSTGSPAPVGAAAQLPANGRNGSNDVEPLAVSVARVGRRSLVRSVTVNAEVAPSREVSVSPQLSGTVAAVNVDVGDRVREGDVLLQLDDEALRAQYQQAVSALELAEANLARLEAGATEEERQQVAASLRQAAHNLDQARRQLERMEQLFNDGAVSKEQLDGARTAYEISKAQHEAAQQQMLRVERGATPEELRAARAQVRQAAAAVELARIQLDHGQVKAPFDGLVSRRSVEVGGLASAGIPALVLVDIDRVYVKGSVSQGYVNAVKPGDEVTVEVSSQSTPFAGVVHTISPAADGAGLFPIRVEIENSDHRLKPGMFATVRIPVARADDAVAVPVNALVRHGDGRAVYTVEAAGGEGGAGSPGQERRGVARLRPVRLGVEDGDWVQVVDGVQEGEWIVVAGHGFLSDGRPVVWTQEE